MLAFDEIMKVMQCERTNYWWQCISNAQCVTRVIWQAAFPVQNKHDTTKWQRNTHLYLFHILPFYFMVNAHKQWVKER